MSRTVHTTYRDLQREMCAEWADATRQEERVQRLRSELRQKRIRKAGARSRRRHPLAAPAACSDCIPIVIRDERDWVHYPASHEDVRAVLRRLPAGVLAGLQGVELSLGTEHVLPGYEVSGDDEIDPFTGRPNMPILPDVWEAAWVGMIDAPWSGTYLADERRICLFAYTYDRSILQREMIELFLRLQSLLALIYQVACHAAVIHWRPAVGSRGRERCSADPEPHTLMHDWACRIVVPYLEEAYAKDAAALEDWTAHYGGFPLSRSLLAGIPPLQAVDEDPVPLTGRSSEARTFQVLLQEVVEGKPLTETRLEFAWGLYAAEHYPETLAILADLLQAHPGHPKALELRAAVYVRQAKYRLAEPLLYDTIAADWYNRMAWDNLADLYEGEGDWPNVLYATTHLLDSCQLPRWRHWSLWLQRARARLELGDFEGVKADLASLRRATRRCSIWWRLASELWEKMASRIWEGMTETA